jgi:hypothetical protein
MSSRYVRSGHPRRGIVGAQVGQKRPKYPRPLVVSDTGAMTVDRYTAPSSLLWLWERV